MGTAKRSIGLALGSVLGVWMVCAAAGAQDVPPDEEPMWEPAPPPPQPPPPPPQAPPPAPEPEPEPEPQSDHAAMVGRMGVGFLGIAAVPDGIGSTIAAPIIGIRKWMSETAGLDVGIGFGLTRSSIKDVPDIGPTSVRETEMGVGGAVHLGLPIALFHQRHYAFLFIPEVDVGFGYNAYDPAPDVPDTTFKSMGVLVQPGIRLGAEVHFGFMGIPHLSLQASVGARMRYVFAKETEPNFFGGNSVVAHDIAFGTTVQNSPWNIFITNVAAIYYF
jgi:hypothetical protein